MSDRNSRAVVGGVIGAVIGFWVGGPAGAQMGWAIGAGIGMSTGPHDKMFGQRLTDLKVQNSTYGSILPVAKGTVRIAGCVIDGQDLQEHAQVEEQGGKGGPTTDITTYYYTCSFAVALLNNPISGITRIWANGNLIYNVSDSTNISEIVSSNSNVDMTVYLGSETQMPDPTLEAIHGVGTVPAYRGVAYVVFTDLDLTDYGNRIPNLEFEVVCDGVETTTAKYLEAPDRYVEWPSYYGVEQPYCLRSSTGLRIGFMESGSIAVANHKRYMRTVTIDPDTNVWTEQGTYEVSDSYHHWVSAMSACPYNNKYYCAIDQYYAYNMNAYFFGTDGSSPGDEAGPNTLEVVSLACDIRRSDGVMVPAAYIKALSAYIALARDGDMFVYACKDAANSINAVMVKTPHGIYQLYDGWVEFVAITRTSIYIRSSWTTLLRYDRNTYTYLDTWTFAAVNSWSVSYEDEHFHVYGDYVYKYNTWKGTVVKTYYIPPGGSSTYNHNEQLGVLSWAGRTPPYNVAVYGAGVAYNHLSTPGEPLSEVVQYMCERAGLLTSEIDVTALTADTVQGVVATSTARATLEQLSSAFMFGSVEHDTQLKFVKKGGAVAATLISADDFLSQPTKNRAGELTLPKSVSITCIDKDSDYQPLAQITPRYDVGNATEEFADEIAVVLTPTQCKYATEVKLFEAWQGRNTLEGVVGPKHNRIEPMDMISVDGETYLIAQRDEGADGKVKISAVAYDASILTRTPVAVVSGTAGQVATQPGEASLIILDIATLRDKDDGGVVYFASYTSGEWVGAKLFRSADNGTTWSEIGFFAREATTGRADSILGNFYGGYTFDELNTVTISKDSTTLPSSISEDTLFAGGNVAILGNEIIAFKNCIDNGDETYTISGMLRGLFGTENRMGTHARDERFVLLNNAVLPLQVPTSSIGLQYKYKAVMLGKTLVSATAQTQVHQGNSTEPLSPISATGSRHPTTFDWTINWIRRSRVDFLWRDYVDASLAETSESYDVEIYSSSAFTVLKRTITVTAQTATYTSANQVTDFGANQTTLYVKIYQNSTTNGKGSPLQATLT